MVVVPKKNGELRICLDPRDLNEAIQWEHYLMPTIEDIAMCLRGAKNFSPRREVGILACTTRR